MIRLLGLILLCLLLGACASNGRTTDPDPNPSPNPNPNPEPNPDPGSNSTAFEGIVRDASGNPIEGAYILIGLNPTTTDTDGIFSYDNLLPGNYIISLMDDAGNFDCLDLTVNDGAAMFPFTLPGKGAMLHAVSVSPPLSSGGSSLDAPLVITFSDEIDAGSVDRSDFVISPDIGDALVTVEGAVVTITPRLQMPTNQRVLVEQVGEITSTGGSQTGQPLRWRFRTSGSDQSAPHFVGSSPGDGKTDFPPNSAVRLEFNETLSAPGSGLTVEITPETEYQAYASGRYLVVSAVNGWEINTEYALSVHGVADTSGNQSFATINLGFTTGEQESPQHHINPEWHRESGKIFFSADQSGSYDIFSINPDGTELTQLTAMPGTEQHPTLSENGNLLAFQYRDGGSNWDIYVLNLESEDDPVVITSDEFSDTQPYFSRTISDRLVYVSTLSSPAGLYLMNSDGSDPTEQDRDFSSVQREPALHPLLDTQMLFTSNTGGDWDIWRKTVSAIDGTAINQNMTSDMLSDEHHPCWGSDAGFLVFISDFGRIDNVWYAEATGEFARQLTFFDNPVLDISVSPVAGDQEAVVSIETGDDTIDLAVIDLVAGEILRWLTGEEAGNS